MKKSITFLFVTLFLVTGLYGCKEEHVCVNKYYLVNDSTCAEMGVVESICSVCGLKTNISLEKNDNHVYEWEEMSDCYDDIAEKGTCSICGVEISDEKEHVFIGEECVDCGALKHYALQENQVSVGHSLSEIVSLLSSKLNCYSEFETTFDKVANASINRIELKGNKLKGNFVFGGRGYNFSFEETLIDFETEKSYDKNICTIEIRKESSSVAYSLSIVYCDGTKVRIGYFEENPENKSLRNYIEKIGINTNKQVVVFYKDGSYSNCGTLIEDVYISEDFIVYEKKQNGYSVCGYLGANLAIEIPKSHLGEDVVGISKNAFAGKSIIDITIGSKIKTVEEEAFKDCLNLSFVTITSEKLITIKENAFLNTNVRYVNYYGGSMENIAVHKTGNEKFMSATWKSVE